MTTASDSRARGVSGAVASAASRLLPGGAGVLAAVSGGSDSMGLLHLLADLKDDTEIELSVGFVDHGLRDVEGEWALVRDAARALGLPIERLRVPAREGDRGGPASGSLQEWARGVRYAALVEAARARGATHVATGHTLDDQAETVLIRMLRGAGLDGIAAIPERRDLDGLVLVRPLLGVAREDVRGYLRDRGIAWAEDPSNEDPRHLRVAVRSEILPSMRALQPRISERLAALSREAVSITGFLDDLFEVEKGLKNLRLNAGIKVDCEVFSSAPKQIWGRIVRAAVRRATGDIRRLERVHVEDVERMIEAGACSGELPLPGEVCAFADRGSLYVFPRGLPRRPTGSGQAGAVGSGLWRARFAALGAVAEIRSAGRGKGIEGMEVRARLPGDRLLGSERRFKEILSDAKVPGPYRDFVPVLAAGDRIVSCPGILPSRSRDLEVSWLLDESAPFLDVDFPLPQRDAPERDPRGR